MSSFALTFNRGKLGLIRLKERPWLCVAHAWVLVYTGQLEAMEPCLQNAEAVLREAAGAALWPANRIEYDRSLALLHESMDETMLAAAWAAGRAMSTEQVMTDTVTGRI